MNLDIDEPIILECQVLIEQIKQALINQKIKPNEFIAYYNTLTCHVCMNSYFLCYNIDNKVLPSTIDSQEPDIIDINEHYKLSSNCKGGIFTWQHRMSYMNTKMEFNKDDNLSYLNYLKILLRLIKKEV